MSGLPLPAMTASTFKLSHMASRPGKQPRLHVSADLASPPPAWNPRLLALHLRRQHFADGLDVLRGPVCNHEANQRAVRRGQDGSSVPVLGDGRGGRQQPTAAFAPELAGDHGKRIGHESHDEAIFWGFWTANNRWPLKTGYLAPLPLVHWPAAELAIPTIRQLK